jgi:hypothetical protein
LEKLCIWLCPALDVSLYVDRAGGELTRVIAASDWKTMPGEALCRRLWIDHEDSYGARDFSKQVEAAEHYSLLKDSSDEIVGRASLIPHIFGENYSSGVVTVGGFRTTETKHVAGILVGNPGSAARDTAIPVIPTEEFQRWASEQAALGCKVCHDQTALIRLSECVRSCGGNTGNLPIAKYGSDWLNFKEIAGKKDWPEEILLLALIWDPKSRLDANGDAIYECEFKRVGDDFSQELIMSHPGILGIPPSFFHREPEVVGLNRWAWWSPPVPPHLAFMSDIEIPPYTYYSLDMAVIEALAKAWDASLEEVLRAEDERNHAVVLREIGVETEDLEWEVSVIRMPKRAE